MGAGGKICPGLFLGAEYRPRPDGCPQSLPGGSASASRCTKEWILACEKPGVLRPKDHNPARMDSFARGCHFHSLWRYSFTLCSGTDLSVDEKIKVKND